MPFNISFDYRFDNTNFFTAEVRSALQAAAADWESRIQDEFARIPAGTAFTFESPSQAPGKRTIELTQPIDDLRIFVGAQDPPFNDPGGEILAQAGVRGFDAPGDALQRRISNDFRGDGPVTDFEPFVAALSVDPTRNWHFGDDAPAADEFDFRSVIRHELGHALGIGQAQVFRDLGAGGSFDGPNARDANDGMPVPLSNDRAHTLPSFRDGDPLMSPRQAQGVRDDISEVDEALLADIGYEIDGFNAQGTQPAIATDGDDRPIRGRVVADTIDGLAGNDKVQGNAGADTLHGGAGDDTLLGQAGADVIRGGTGNDKVQGGPGNDLLRGGAGQDFLFGNGSQGTPNAPDVDTFYVGPGDGRVSIQDFAFETERIVIDPAIGVSSIQTILDNVDPLQNGSRIDLGASGKEDVIIDILHDPIVSPLTSDNIAIQRIAAVTDETSGGGSSGEDRGNAGGEPRAPDGPPVDAVGKAFLASGHGMTIADPVKVFGRADSDEAVVFDAQASGVRADANIERFDFPSPLADMHFAVTARGLEITADGDRMVTIPSLNGSAELRFPDGNASLTHIDAGRFKLAGTDGTAQILDANGGGADVMLGDAESRSAAAVSSDGQRTGTIFLEADGGITVHEPVRVFGRSEGGEHVALADQADGVRLDANVDDLTLPQPLDALTFGVGATGLEIADDGARPLVTAPSLNGPMAVQFADGSATLTQTGPATFEIAGATTGAVPIDGAPQPVDLDLGNSAAQAVNTAALPPTTADDSFV